MLHFLSNAVKGLSLPFFYYGGIAVMLASILRRAEWGLMVLVGLNSQPNIYYKLYSFPLGKDFLDLMAFSVLLGIFVHKGGITNTANSILIGLFLVLSYFSLWMTSLNFYLPLPITLANPLIRPWKSYVVMMGFYFLGMNVIKDDERQQRYILLIIVLVLLFVSIRSYRAFTAGVEFSDETRYSGPFWIVGLGSNHFGAFIAQYSMLILGLFFLDGDWRRRVLYIATVILCIHPLFFAYSRGSYAAALAGIAFYGIFKKRILLIFLAVLYICWQTFLPPSVVERIMMTEEYDGQLEQSGAARLHLWDRALMIFESNPVMGVGWGGFGYAIREESNYRDTHNFFLKTLCEQGVVGFGFLILLLIAAMMSGFQLMRSGKNAFHQGLGLGFMGSTVALMVNNLFGDRFSYIELGGYFWLVWGLVDRSIIMGRMVEKKATKEKDLLLKIVGEGNRIMKGLTRIGKTMGKGVLILLLIIGSMGEKMNWGKNGKAFANTFHVSPNGSDGNSGSINRPWASIQFAVSHAGSGDEILVRGGTYQEGEIWIRGDFAQGGKEGRLLTIRAYPGEKPLFVNGKRPFIIQCDYIRVEGLHFSNGKSLGIQGIGRKGIQIVKNHFSGKEYAWAAIGVGGNDILLEGNVCDLQGNVLGTQGHCYYISHGANMIIRNNIARGSSGYGIHVFDQRRSEDFPNFKRLIKNVIIEGNIACSSLERAGIVIGAYDHASIENVTIRNNVIFDNAGLGIFIPGIAKNIFVFHNTIYGNRGGPALYTKGGTREVENLVIRNNIFDLSGISSPQRLNYHVINENSNPSIILENNLYWPEPSRLLHVSDKSPIIGNPFFRDVGGRDFRLKEGSAAIDRGINSDDARADKDGTRRPQGRASDLGAYEYVPTAAR